jgi:malonyl-CoA decarboxylase
MATSFGPDFTQIETLVDKFKHSQNKYSAYMNLKKAITPSYEQFLEHVIKQPNGLKFVIDMRADLLSILATTKSQELSDLDSTLYEILSSWVTLGFLELKELTWECSASMLDNVCFCLVILTFRLLNMNACILSQIFQH